MFERLVAVAVAIVALAATAVAGCDPVLGTARSYDNPPPWDAGSDAGQDSGLDGGPDAGP